MMLVLVVQVVLYNRGKTANKQLPCESDAEYAKRVEDVKTIVGDRKDPEVRDLIDSFECVIVGTS